MPDICSNTEKHCDTKKSIDIVFVKVDKLTDKLDSEIKSVHDRIATLNTSLALLVNTAETTNSRITRHKHDWKQDISELKTNIQKKEDKTTWWFRFFLTSIISTGFIIIGKMVYDIWCK